MVKHFAQRKSQIEVYALMGISGRYSKLIILTVITGALFIATIIYAGIQGADSGMSIWRLGLRFLIFFWMVSIFDAVVLDWWMFIKVR